MLSILGVGSSFPPVDGGAPSAEGEGCLVGGCTTPGAERVSSTPTMLAVAAVRQALARANVTPEQCGLVLGEACSPLETTPSEAQRVAGVLGLKIPAYDMSASGLGLLFALKVLSEWRDEVIPDYVVWFSVATPSCQEVGPPGEVSEFFGDGAVAVVLSSRLPGRLQVRDLCIRSSGAPSLVECATYGGLTCDLPKLTAEWQVRALELEHELHKKHPGVLGASDLFASARNGSSGYLLGAHEAVGLALRWDEGFAKPVVIMPLGVGTNYGYALLGSGGVT